MLNWPPNSPDLNPSELQGVSDKKIKIMEIQSHNFYNRSWYQSRDHWTPSEVLKGFIPQLFGPQKGNLCSTRRMDMMLWPIGVCYCALAVNCPFAFAHKHIKCTKVFSCVACVAVTCCLVSHQLYIYLNSKKCNVAIKENLKKTTHYVQQFLQLSLK